MKLQFIHTTDNQHIAMVIELPNPILKNVVLPLSEGVNFRIDNTQNMGNGHYRYSNPHYVAVVKEV